MGLTEITILRELVRKRVRGAERIEKERKATAKTVREELLII